MSEQKYRVKAQAGLNLRSQPIVKTTNRVAVLPFGHVVRRVSESTDPAWWKVETTLQGADVEGFVAHSFLDPIAEPVPVLPISNISAVHMAENRPDITRDRTNGRAYPLGEPGRPARKAGSGGEKVESLGDIIEWLDVEGSPRYRPGSGFTYCNIYAYDYCYLSGVYLPRVWWTPPALATLSQGGTVQPGYGVTIRELNANSLYDWLSDYGPQFGWSRTFDLNELQDAADEGGVGIICAKRRDLNRSGHIVAVVPQGNGHQALRRDGRLLCPLQSQAGATNFSYGTGRSPWWTSSKFSEFGYWQHA